MAQQRNKHEHEQRLNSVCEKNLYALGELGVCLHQAAVLRRMFGGSTLFVLGSDAAVLPRKVGSSSMFVLGRDAAVLPRRVGGSSMFALGSDGGSRHALGATANSAAALGTDWARGKLLCSRILSASAATGAAGIYGCQRNARMHALNKNKSSQRKESARTTQ